MRGKFITLEGIDGAGKSTHHAWLVDHLKNQGREIVATREPGGTGLGEKLRALLLSEPMHLETEALLMFAARREHMDKLIQPALEAGKWVVSDRFTDASYAYQGGGRGLARERIQVLERWVQAGFQPDITFVFDLPVEVAFERLAKTGNVPDRFEQETREFFERVRKTYLRRAATEPDRIKVVDSRQSITDIQKVLEIHISTI
ncbi:MAG: dTMP kinase [Rhodocyclaceae bacterium]|nr:dTMP kinase [Rhodocyclaceae bacterium]MCW5595004.1 dTMP kinase [Rhodocyclaceae bacterium]PKO71395.1 MAG: dTMP kinase [Betaproteobacteria bacterium HGW-Betaproteobacteria-14]PKO89282.1 MAG: dTMP kinase [Betaproteobacteria bacterium HGW-Betaproteobacteria-10]